MKATILELMQTVVIALIFYTVLHLFIIQPNKVEGSSMVPTFHTDDRIITSRLTYRFETPQRGDIIVFTPPQAAQGDFIKRIIGLPGETIMVNNGQVYINGQLLTENYLPQGTPTIERHFLHNGVPYQIPADDYIVFGDNRNFSSDSREWGPINKSEIIGKVWVQYWPPSEVRVVQ